MFRDLYSGRRVPWWRTTAPLLVASLLLACSPLAPTASVPRVFPTATWAPHPTSTPDSAALFWHELSAVKSFQGSLMAADYDASYRIAHAYLRSANGSLASIQWDALQAQRAVWQGSPLAVPDGWIVSIHFYDGPMLDGGKPIAVADVGTVTGRTVNWSQLSPAQAWQVYDNVLYNPQGI